MAAPTDSTDVAKPVQADDGTGPPKRRPRKEEVQEVVDELAQETRRASLLDQVEKQLKGRQHVSRILFAFPVSDEKKVHTQLEQEFASWRKKHEKEAESVTGVMLFAGQAAINFLEGPTEDLFEVVSFFNTLSPDGQAVAAPGPEAGRDGARPALIGALRVLHFTELRAARISRSWCAVSHTGKAHGTQVQLEENNCADLVYASYGKLAKLCQKVRDQLADETQVDSTRLASYYRRSSELFPTVDEVLLLLSKPGAELFFGWAEFQKVFTAPLHLTLNSELLWPMPPALSY